MGVFRHFPKMIGQGCSVSLLRGYSAMLLEYKLWDASKDVGFGGMPAMDLRF